MKLSDLSQKSYPVNRKLSAEERKNQLFQKEQLNIVPFYNVSTITLNSTFVEMVDRWFIYRGVMSFGGLLCFGVSVLILAIPFLAPPLHMVPTEVDLLFLKMMLMLFLPLYAFLAWGITRESFRWTHFPIRFNHRNKMVYVFCLDGVIRSAKWDDLFFTLGRCGTTPMGPRWDVRGHALKADRETVEWTFALNGDNVDIRQLKHFWEFVRRYMEEGPQSVYRDVFWCHDIASKRETYRAGLNVLFLTHNGLPFFQKLFSPIFALVALGRWFAMKTSKIPQWPAEIEEQCAVDAFDPYQRTATHNPEKIPTDPGSVAWDRFGS